MLRSILVFCSGALFALVVIFIFVLDNGENVRTTQDWMSNAIRSLIPEDTRRTAILDTKSPTIQAIETRTATVTHNTLTATVPSPTAIVGVKTPTTRANETRTPIAAIKTPPAVSPPDTAASLNETRTPTAAAKTMTAILPFPRSIVFGETGESQQMTAIGVYSDGSEATLPDKPGSQVFFTSTEPDVVMVNSAGHLTAVSPGAADIVLEYGDFRSEASIIVYGSIVEIPPLDPNKIVQIEDGPEAVVNRVIVAPLTEEYDAVLSAAIASDYGGTVIAEFKNLNLFLLEFEIDNLGHLQTKLSQMESDDKIESVNLNYLFVVSQQPSPTPTNATMVMAANPNTSDLVSAYTSLGLEDAWKLANTEAHLHHTVHIIVIDNGFAGCQAASPSFCKLFDFNDISTIPAVKFHPKSNTVGYQFSGDDSDPAYSKHGIAVSSVIVAVSNTLSHPKIDLSGVVTSVPINYRLHFYSVGTITSHEKIDTSKVVSALDHMHGYSDEIDVVNMSIELSCDPKNCYTPTFFDNIVRKYRRIRTDIKLSDQAVFVAAAGNENRDASHAVPANLSYLDNVITVGGLNKSLDRRWMDTSTPSAIRASNYGKAITVAAQAQDVFAVHNTSSNRYSSTFSGTSFAAPLVSGVVALMRAVDPDIPPSLIKQILTSSGKPIPVTASGGNTEIWKMVDACEGVRQTIILRNVREQNGQSGPAKSECSTPIAASTPVPQATLVKTPTTVANLTAIPTPAPTSTPKIDTMNTHDIDPRLVSAYTSLRLEGAWKLVSTGKLNPVNIAVIDDGFIDCLSSPMSMLCEKFDNNRIKFPMYAPSEGSSEPEHTFHGTAVSSILATDNDGTALSGVVASVPIDYTLDFYSIGTPTDAESDFGKILDALEHMRDNGKEIDVVNISVAHRCAAECSSLDSAQKLKEVVEIPEGNLSDTVFVVTAGNNNEDASQTMLANLSYLDNVITVGGLIRNSRDRYREYPAITGKIGNGSNYGDHITIAAHAQNVYVVDSYSNGYSLVNGTGFAAPFVSGIVALMRAVDPNISPGGIKQILTDYAVTTDATLNDSGVYLDLVEWKMANACEAVRQTVIGRNNRENNGQPDPVDCSTLMTETSPTP